MAHTHPVYDTEAHFLINPTTRKIVYQSDDRLVIVQGDHNSQRYTFEVPRYIDGHDMLLCDVCQIHYINVGAGDTRSRNTGVYEATDIMASSDDKDTVVFTWLVSRNATSYAGSLNFVIHFACTSNTKVEYSWNTTISSDISIITSIDNAEVVVEDYADILEQWYAELIAAGSTSISAIHEARDDAINELQNSADTIHDTIIADATNSIEQNVEGIVSDAEQSIAASVNNAEQTAKQNVLNYTNDYLDGLEDGAYRVIEQNKLKAVDFWFGTTQEFSQLSETVNNRVYVNTDDRTLEMLDSAFNDIDVEMLNIKDGTQKVGSATNADYATNAGNADYSTNAGNANHATKAENADYATKAGAATVLSVTDANTTHDFTTVTTAWGDDEWVHDNVIGGIYVIRVKRRGTGTQTRCSFLFEFDGYNTTYSVPFQYDAGKDVKTAVVKAEPVADNAGYMTLCVVAQPLSTETELSGFEISTRCISQQYAIG